MITFIEAIVCVAFALMLIRLIWNDGYSSGQNCVRRAQIRETNKVNGQVESNRRHIHGLDNRIDGIEARLAQVEKKNKTLKMLINGIYGDKSPTTIYANGEPYAVVDDDAVENPYQDSRCDTCQNKDEGLVCTACHDGGCYTKTEETE